MRIRRSYGPRVKRRTADLLRDLVLYASSAVFAGLFAWLIVLLTGATPS